MQLTKNQLRKMILEERALVLQERREFVKKTSLICEIAIEQHDQMLKEGFTLQEANMFSFDSLMGLASKFLGGGAQFKALKENILEYLIDMIATKFFKVDQETVKEGWLFCAIREALVNIDYGDLPKYFGEEKCKELSKLIIVALNECGNKKFYRKFVGEFLGLGTDNMLSKQIEQLFSNAMQGGIIEQLEIKLAGYLCEIDFSGIFSSLMGGLKGGLAKATGGEESEEESETEAS